jgi:hypothetical protein
MSRPIILSEKDEQFIIDHHNKWKETEIMAHLNISRATIQKYKYKHGLVKTKKGDRIPGKVKNVDEEFFNSKEYENWVA